MRRIRVRASARSDIKQITGSISVDRPRSARRFMFAVEKLIKRLVDFPELGAFYECDEVEFMALRVMPIGRFKRFLLFYRVHDDEIEVVRIIHGARDIPAILEGFA